MIIRVSAPSNIALIKYMGKVSRDGNWPTNPSLSWTLEGLRSFVEIEEITAAEDKWEPLKDLNSISLSENGKRKFLGHLARCREHFNDQRKFVIRSGNNFPSDAGIASSASSFAALTKAVFQFYSDKSFDIKAASRMSRLGSGSSCRSFYAPWALWREDSAETISLPYEELFHQVILVDNSIKKVSSSEAHMRVTSSLLFQGRVERAQLRLSDLISALNKMDWRLAFELCWSEFWDMHALFETSNPSFGYLKAGTLDVLSKVRRIWEAEGDGPITTLDAGPNVHLLWRPDQENQMIRHLSHLTSGREFLFTDLKGQMKAQRE